MTPEHQEIWSPSDLTFFGPDSRCITFWGEVNEESSLTFISQLMELSSEHPDEPITVYLNTSGGSFMEAYAIYDAIQTCQAPVTIIVTGFCASAGLTILCAAENRLATKNALFFYHQTILKSDKELNSIECSIGTAEAYKLCHDMYDRTLIDTTKMTKEQWKTNFKDKTVKYFTSKEALEFGFIQRIVPIVNRKYPYGE